MSVAHQPPGVLDLSPRTRLVAGRGTLANLGDLTAPIGRRIALITDEGLRTTGLIDRARQSLERAGLTVELFDQARPNPTEADIESCRAALAPFAPDVWIGLGGGSALDTAKAAALLSTNGGRMRDYWGWAKAKTPAPPVIAVPTTAGTGSETQSYALISRDGDHRKLACGDPSIAPRIALLDPEVLHTCPRDVAITAALDTLVHGLETAVTTKRNQLSIAWSHRCTFLAWHGLHAWLQDPHGLEALEWLQWASALGGLAIESSMLGAAHAAANPLTARLDVPHGRAVALMVPAVMRFNANAPTAARHYQELALVLGLGDVGTLIDRVTSLIHRVAPSLAFDVAPRARPIVTELAHDAADQWTGRFNPRPVDAAVFEALYADAFRNA